MRTTLSRAACGLLVAVALPSCAQLGFTDRELIRLASPDGHLVFVCQEIPELDGPGHEWRLERQDGTVVRRLFTGSDGNGACHEARWSADGGTLAVVERDTIHIADVEWTLAHPDLQKTHWFVRQFSFHGRAGGGPFWLVQHLRFVAPGELVFDVCDYRLESVRQSGVPGCHSTPTPKTLTIPSPFVPGRAS